jgi:hypothetical protein
MIVEIVRWILQFRRTSFVACFTSKQKHCTNRTADNEYYASNSTRYYSGRNPPVDLVFSEFDLALEGAAVPSGAGEVSTGFGGIVGSGQSIGSHASPQS